MLAIDRAWTATWTFSSRRRSGEGQGEGISKERDNSRNEPLSPALSPLLPHREREQKTSAMVGVSSCARLGTGNRVRFVQKACDGYTAKFARGTRTK